MKATVVDHTGKKTRELELPKTLFGVKVSPQLLAQYIRVYLFRNRQAGAKALSRSEVSGSTAKVWRQKGTGRARHGSRKAPIFVKGGQAHGPSGEQNYSLTISKAQKRKALLGALGAVASEVTILENVDKLSAKTKDLTSLLTTVLGEKSGEQTVILLDKVYDNVLKAARNIENVKLSQAVRTNPYELLSTQHIIMTDGSLELLEKTFITASPTKTTETKAKKTKTSKSA